MKINENSIFPLIKVKTPTGIDFFNAHILNVYAERYDIRNLME